MKRQLTSDFGRGGESGDHATALNAIREVRRGLELVARLTGGLNERPNEGGKLKVNIVYTSAQPAVNAARPLVDVVPTPLPEPD